MIELRILNLFENLNNLDPLNTSIFSIDELSEICDSNEIYAAKDSLDSELIHWKDGKKVICREWIQNLLSDLTSTAEKFHMKHLLNPIYKVLEEGNQSMKWITQYEKGFSIEQIMQMSIEDMIKIEDENV
jgi:predicted glutamate--cysteine ligase